MALPHSAPVLAARQDDEEAPSPVAGPPRVTNDRGAVVVSTD